jgi:hypothetical protein
MRCITKSLLAFLLGAAISSRDPTVPRQASDSEHDESGAKFAVDVAARFNEMLLANVDAIDTGLTAILAGTVAVVVFTIDKLRELQEPETWIALGLLAGATIACILGYSIGVPWRGFGNRDGIRPSLFIPDFARHASSATTTAARQLTKAGEINLTVRLWKRMLAVVALTFLIAGVTLVALARFNGKVI